MAHYATNGALYRIVPAASALSLLTVSKAGNGAGRVTSTPASVFCGSVCGARYSVGASVTLTATPDPGWSFTGFGGDADCADSVLTMSADRSCTVAFTRQFTDGLLVPGTTAVKAYEATSTPSFMFGATERHRLPVRLLPR